MSIARNKGVVRGSVVVFRKRLVLSGWAPLKFDSFGFDIAAVGGVVNKVLECEVREKSTVYQASS